MTDHRDEHEPYGFTESPVIARLHTEIARLTAERDEARRLVCAHISSEQALIGLPQLTLQEVAETRGWDCWKENP